MKQVRLDRIFTVVKDLVPLDDIELLTPSVVHGVVPQKSLKMRPQQAKREGYKVAPAQPDDFVISLSSHSHGIEWCGMNGGISPDYTLLRPLIDKTYCGYLKYALKDRFVVAQLGLFKSGIRMGLRLQWNDVRYCKVQLPSTSDAHAIANYLDRETARIDTLIEKKTRFIELLKEKSQALITHAVTKGLDSDVPMNNSGVEWIGEVPEHWEVCKLNYKYSVDLGKMLDEKRNIGSHPVPYLRNQDVQWSGVNTDYLPVMDISPSEFARYTAVSGDLLVCEGGEAGRAAIWEGKPIGYQKALHRLRPRHQDEPRFMCLVLQAAKLSGAFEEGDTKATISHLPADKFRDFKFAFPPPDEQEQITRHVQERTTRIDTLIAHTERSIKLLCEKRSALITAAVTGKIDARAFQEAA